MKYKVISSFIDKDSNDLHPIDSLYETKDEKRVKFLQNNGFLGEQIEASEKPKSNKSKKPNE